MTSGTTTTTIPAAAAAANTTKPLHNQSLDDGFFYYLEANLLASAPLPGGASYVLASFPKLFGSPEGRRVAAFSESRGWPLAWAFGAGLDRGVLYPPPGTSWAGNRRLWDPRNAHLRALFNVSGSNASGNASGSNASGNAAGNAAGSAAAASFEGVWAAVARKRLERFQSDGGVGTPSAPYSSSSSISPSSSSSSSPPPPAPPVPWAAEEFATWWADAAAAAGPALQFEPLLPGACADTRRCVGLVLGAGTCICRS